MCLQQMFGMAEDRSGSSAITTARDDGAQPGRPLPGDEIRVVDKGSRCPRGRGRRLLARGVPTIRGYYRAPEHNRRSFTSDGYYRTGDLVRLLPHGFVEFTG